MKKAIIALSLFTLIIGKTSAQVTIYSNNNYTGRSYTFTKAGTYTVYDLPEGYQNFVIKSVKMLPGWKVDITTPNSEEPRSWNLTENYKSSDVLGIGSGSFLQLKVTAPAATRPAPATTLKNTLAAGKTLGADGILTSQNGKFILKMQKIDGHLCVYNFENGKQGMFVWGTGVHGFPNASLALQQDGNLVVLDGNKTIKWSSKTDESSDATFNDPKNKPVKLVLENDGSINLYNSANTVVWSNKN